MIKVALVTVTVIAIGTLYQNYTLRDTIDKMDTLLDLKSQVIDSYAELTDNYEINIGLLEELLDKRDEYYIEALKKSCTEIYL